MIDNVNTELIPNQQFVQMITVMNASLSLSQKFHYPFLPHRVLF